MFSKLWERKLSSKSVADKIAKMGFIPSTHDYFHSTLNIYSRDTDTLSLYQMYGAFAFQPIAPQSLEKK